MKTKIFSFLFLLMAATLTVHAQSDVVSLAQAVRIFQNPRQQSANDLLTKQGYQYKGVSTAFGKEYTWVKNMDLTKDGLPTKATPPSSSSTPTASPCISASSTLLATSSFSSRPCRWGIRPTRPTARAARSST